MAPVQVTVRIQKDESAVQITRTGGVESCLIVEKAKRNQCNYDTGFGNLLMGIYGRIIEMNIQEDNGSFTFGYDIDVNGAVTSKNTVKLAVSRFSKDAFCGKIRASGKEAQRNGKRPERLQDHGV